MDKQVKKKDILALGKSFLHLLTSFQSESPTILEAVQRGHDPEQAVQVLCGRFLQMHSLLDAVGAFGKGTKGISKSMLGREELRPG